MKNFIFKVLMIYFWCISFPIYAAPELLLKTDKSWDGGSFVYPEGDVEITSIKLILQKGQETQFHCHPVPTMGFISQGKVLLETENGKSKEYQKGDSVVEVMKGLHRGKALENDAEIIVFYAGVKGVPNTVFPDDKNNFKKYCL